MKFDQLGKFAALIRDELKNAQFRVTQLERGLIQRTGDDATVGEFKQRDLVDYDANGLRSLHDSGSWKRDLLQTSYHVHPLSTHPASEAREKRFEKLLENVAVCEDSWVHHALGRVLPGGTEIPTQQEYLEAYGGEVHVSALWHYVLTDACLSSPERAAARLVQWVEGDPVTYETCILLGGLRTPDPVKLSPSITIERLPDYSELLGELIQTGAGIPIEDYLGRTILRTPCTFSPGLSHPKNTSFKSDNGAYIKASWGIPEGGVWQIIWTLSLVCNVTVNAAFIWTNYGDRAHFGQTWSSGKLGDGKLPPQRAGESVFTNEVCRTATDLLPKMHSLSDEIKTALKYWHKSKAYGVDPIDAFVYLRTALEALFIGKGNQTELRYRLSLVGAWYTGRDRTDREARFESLSQFYKAASSAVHTGRVKGARKKHLRNAQDICRDAILTLIRSGIQKVPDDIVFGSC